MELNDHPDDDVIRLLIDALADLDTQEPPPALRSRVLAAARRERAPGRPAGTVSPTPIECYRRTVAELDDLLASLDRTEWSTVVDPYEWSIQGLVGHLVVVARYLATGLGTDDLQVPAEVESDHIGMTLAEVAAQTGRDPADTLADWRAATDRVLEGLGADVDLAARVPMHGLPFALGPRLVAQSFEAWIHADDIRRATGRPLTAPDAGRLTLMTDLAVRILPMALQARGRADVRGSANIVLTGPGGGAWVQPLGREPEPGPPEVSIVADVVDFCRFAGRRLPRVDLDATIEGDRELAEAVLEAAASLAV
jgi:uncharacterized protein (TIGR03083 family)